MTFECNFCSQEFIVGVLLGQGTFLFFFLLGIRYLFLTRPNEKKVSTLSAAPSTFTINGDSKTLLESIEEHTKTRKDISHNEIWTLGMEGLFVSTASQDPFTKRSFTGLHKTNSLDDMDAGKDTSIIEQLEKTAPSQFVNEDCKMEAAESDVGKEPEEGLYRWSTFESTHWLKTFFCSLFSFYRSSERMNSKLRLILEDQLNEVLPPFLGKIEIVAAELGSSFPLFNHIQLSTFYKDNWEISTRTKKQIFTADMEWMDYISFTVKTQVLINWPQLLATALPVTVTLIFKKIRAKSDANKASETESGDKTNESKEPASPRRFSKDTSSPPGRASPSPTYTNSPQIVLSFHPNNFLLDYDIHATLGDTTKLVDVPRLMAWLRAKINSSIMNNLIFPQFIIFDLPP